MIDSLPICKQKWVWSFFALQIPKCGTTSIQKTVGQRNLIEKHRQLVESKYQKHPLYRGVFDVRHLIPEHAVSLFGAQVFDFLSFCVIRNPIQRIISSYFFGRERKLHFAYGLPESTTFDEYIRWLYKNKNDKNILILLPQKTWAVNDFFPVEILRFENLQQEWRNFLQKYQITGLPETLPWENKTKNKEKTEISAENLKMILDFTSEDRILYPQLYV